MSGGASEILGYEGKLTCCHSQAALTAFFDRDAPSIELFETLSSVPFGVVSVADDPNRLLTSYLDPDVGLDRAFDALGMRHELRFWPPGTDPEAPFELLREWCSQGPAVIGPLNMDGLRYLFHRELYTRCDHYLVAYAISDDGVWVCDTEGSPREHIRWAALADAWRGDRIPEGRGEFGLRRAWTGAGTRDRDAARACALDHAVTNMEEAARLPRGGAGAFTALCEEAARLETDASSRRGLSFVISTRIQRCLLGRRFFRELRARASRTRREALGQLDAALALQIDLLADVLADLMERVSGGLSRFERIAVLEDRLLTMGQAARGAA